MSVLIIKEHSRFAVCRKANVRLAEGPAADALLVELSLDGCRLGNVPESVVAPGKHMSVEVDGAPPLSGTVRWRVDGSLGLKFAKPLHRLELDRLIRLCRGEPVGRTAIRA